jgi:hypothetical protein
METIASVHCNGVSLKWEMSPKPGQLRSSLIHLTYLICVSTPYELCPSELNDED